MHNICIYIYTCIYCMKYKYAYIYMYIYILYALRKSRRGHWRLCGREAWCRQDMQGVSGSPLVFMEGLGGPWVSIGGPWGSLGASLRGSLGALGGVLRVPLEVLGGPWGSPGANGRSLEGPRGVSWLM